MPDAPPKPVFGKYQVEDLLGEGGMGRVWRAYDPDLEVPVAIKELKEQFRDQANLERFFREAQIAAKCRHQNIVLITDLSKTPPFFVMEFLKARELSTYVHKGKPISLALMVKLLAQVCDGLGFLHGRGIFHRDLKPANIMLLEDDTVKITDFGISKAPFGQATMTQVIMGTIPYMSPEQITSPSKVDGRSDLWALGVILYELVQRKHPFPGEGDINTIFHIVHSAPAPLGKMPPAVEGPLQTVLTKALNKNADERYQSTAEFKAMLLGLLRGVPNADEVIFPLQEFTGTVTFESPGGGFTILGDMGDRAKLLAEQIEKLPEEKKALLEESGAHRRAMDIARMARVLIEDKNPVALEAAIRDLESQQAALEAGVSKAVVRLLSDAEDLMLDGQFAEAAENYRRILSADPKHAEARRGLERAEEGLEAGKKAGEHVSRGRALLESGDPRGAAQELKRALGMQPGHAEGAALLAEANARIARAEKAGTLVEQARALLQSRAWEKADDLLKEALALDPRNRDAAALKAQAEKGIEALLQAEALREEARSFLKAEDWEHAGRAWTSLLEIDPADGEAREALSRVKTALDAKDSKERGSRAASEAEARLRAGDLEKALELYEEAGRLNPADTVIRKALDATRRGVESLRAAERDAAAKEKAGDLAGALGAWETARGLQKTHVRAGPEVERLTALLRREEERRQVEQERQRSEEARRRADDEARRRAEEEKRKSEEDRRRLVAQKQKEGEAALESLAQQIAAARESLDDRTVQSIKESVTGIRKAFSSEDLKVLEGAHGDIEATRKKVKEATRRASESALKEVAGPIAKLKEIPKEDHPAIDAALMGRAMDLVARLEAAAAEGDLHKARESAAALPDLAQQALAKRDAALARAAPPLKDAVSALESALKANAPHLKEGTAAAAREAIGRAQKDLAGQKVAAVQKHVEGLKAQRDAILREIQETLRYLRDGVQKARAALEANATKNRRAVAKRADLSKKIDGLLKEAGAASASESVDTLSRLTKDLEAVTGQVPTDPLRFLPHAIAAAGVLVAAGGFVAWRYMQSHTAHAYMLRVVPWGRIVSIQADGGSQVPAPPGDSPFHALSLLPGKYTLTVENPAIGARETVTADIPSQSAGEVKLQGSDYKQGVRTLLSRDPFFSQGP